MRQNPYLPQVLLGRDGLFVVRAGCLVRGKAHASPGSSFVADVVRASSVCKVQGSLALTEEHPNQFPLRKEMGPSFFSFKIG